MTKLSPRLGRGHEYLARFVSPSLLGQPAAGPGVAVLGDGQAEVAAQGRRLVLVADDAALLQDRDDLFAEAAPLAGVGDVDVEAVEGARLEPLADLVGDRARRAGERGRPGGGDVLDRLAEREVVVPATPADVLRLGAEAALGRT